jgi:toxin ParE1/3/4
LSRIKRRAGVDEDIYEAAAYLLSRSEDAAFRFVDAVQKTLKDIAVMPGIGSIKNYSDPQLIAVRSWPVEGFRNYLILYLIMEDGIDVLAIMHGARQIEGRLEERI